MDRLVDSATGLRATMAPLEALRGWTTALVGYMRMKHGLGDAISPGALQPVTEQTYGPAITATGQVLDAGTWGRNRSYFSRHWDYCVNFEHRVNLGAL